MAENLGNISEKEKAKKSRFSSLRLRSSTTTDSVLQEELPDKAIKALDLLEHQPSRHKRSTSVDADSSTNNQFPLTQDVKNRASTTPISEQLEEVDSDGSPSPSRASSARPQSKKKRQRWTTMRTAATKLMKTDTNTKSFAAISRRNSELQASDAEHSPFPGIKHHQPEPEHSPFPGIKHHQPEGSLTVAVSLPSKRMKQNFAPSQSLRQLRNSLALPGTSKGAPKNQKNLAHYITKKATLITDIDKVKTAPLATSKHPVHLKFSSKECKLNQTKFLQDFQDNVKS